MAYLWGVHHNHIEAVPTSPQISNNIHKIIIDIHKDNIKSSENPRNSTHVEDLTGPPKVMEQMNACLGQLISNSIMNHAASSAATKKKFENRLNPLFRKPILTGSAIDSGFILSNSTEESQTFFEQKNSSDAKSFLQHKLIVEKNLPIYIPAGLITSIWSGVVFWYR